VNFISLVAQSSSFLCPLTELHTFSLILSCFSWAFLSVRILKFINFLLAYSLYWAAATYPPRRTSFMHGCNHYKEIQSMNKQYMLYSLVLVANACIYKESFFILPYLALSCHKHQVRAYSLPMHNILLSVRVIIHTASFHSFSSNPTTLHEYSYLFPTFHQAWLGCEGWCSTLFFSLLFRHLSGVAAYFFLYVPIPIPVHALCCVVVVIYQGWKIESEYNCSTYLEKNHNFWISN